MTGAPQLGDTGLEEFPRPRRRNPLTRVTASHLLMVLAAVLAFATNLMVLRGQDETRPVVVAGTRIEAGRTISAADLSIAEVDVNDDLFATLIPGQQSSGLVGMVATRSIESGRMLGTDDLRPASAPVGLRAISIPIEVEHAVGGNIVPGDRIDLISVTETGPVYVLSGVEVLQIPDSSRGSITGATGYFVVVAVDDAQALAVAGAIQGGGLEVVRSTGSKGASE